MSIQIVVAVVVAVLVVVAIGLIITMTALRMRSRNLKRKFGPEYDYTLDKVGDRRTAETELIEREKRVNELTLHDLSDSDRDRYHQEWIDIQSSFIDDPKSAAERANREVTEVMIARGFPVADFEERSEDLSVLYPDYVVGYREANSILMKSHDDGVRTEDFRRAILMLHSLFDVLISFVHQPETVNEVSS